MALSIRKRVSAVIIKDNKVLLIKRLKPNLEYFTFPGGGIEENESIELALKREVKEELSLNVKKFTLLFKLEDQYEDAYNNMHKGNQYEYYFRINNYEGNPEIGGPERERMNKQNQYQIMWFSVEDLNKKSNIFPKGVAKKIAELMSK